MTRDEINRLIQDNGLFHGTVSIGVIMDMNHLERLVALVAAAEREKVAAWMIQRGYATGHGDTTEDLLNELNWQIAERIAAEREACAQVCDALHYEVDAYGAQCAAAIRARGQE